MRNPHPGRLRAARELEVVQAVAPDLLAAGRAEELRACTALLREHEMDAAADLLEALRTP